MRCLILSPFVPLPAEDGGRIRIFELMKGLAHRHDVDLLTLGDGSEASRDGAGELRRLGFTVDLVEHRTTRLRTMLRAARSGRSFYNALFWTQEYRERLQDRLESIPYDVVQCEYPYTGQYRLRVRGVRERWVLDEHNVEFALAASLSEIARPSARRLYRGYAAREVAARRREELAVCRAVERVLTVSEPDREVLQEALPDLRVAVVPNGVDLERFAPVPSAGRADASAVFVGKLDYRPNVDAVTWFSTAVLPIVRGQVPSFSLTIVGRDPSQQVSALAGIPGVEVAGRVEDTRPFLRAAAVTVLPLRAGSGTRLKLLEALAMARPVVATTAACAGVAVEPGTHVLVADTAEDFAAAVLRLLSDHGERLRLGANGRALVEAEYGWTAAVDKLRLVYEELAETPATAGGRRE